MAFPGFAINALNLLLFYSSRINFSSYGNYSDAFATGGYDDVSTTTTQEATTVSTPWTPNVPSCDFTRNRRDIDTRNRRDIVDMARHGYVLSPPSRALLCQRRVNLNCGAVMYEPQSVEGPKGFPGSGPQDGHIASANNARFKELDQYGPNRWARIELSRNLCRENNGSYRLSIQWHYTAPHATSAYHLFATDATYDSSSAPLTRQHLRHVETIPVGDRGLKRVLHTIDFNVPFDQLHREGSLLVIWDIADTANAFYQVVDYKLTDARLDTSSCLRDDERCVKYGYSRNYCDCRRFFQCWSNKVYEKVCPTGLAFDETTNTCNWRDRVNTTGIPCIRHLGK